MATKHTTPPAKKPAEADPPPSRLLWPLAVLAVLLIGLAVVLWPRGHKYPPATSRESYVIMDALHTACNTKNTGSLAKIEAWIARQKTEGKLGADEDDAFARIIATARAGRWSEADREAVHFSQDQVGRGRLFDENDGRGKHGAAASGSR
jgi:hypothetical protein